MSVESEWILFVDSDVKIEPDALRRMMALSLQRGYDAVSILTAIETHRFVEKLGVESLRPEPGHYGLSAAVGGLELTLSERD